jgi:aryl-alcohol dehydrogenase-like predicted oxidoreductase
MDSSEIKMPYRHLGNSGLKVSILSFGTMLMDYDEEKNTEWVEIAKAAFKAGINYFDSAEFYGLGQGDRNLGRAIKEFECDRKNVVVAVKIYKSGFKPTEGGMSRKHIIEGCLRSLKNMDLEYCDLVFSHRQSFEIDLEETCRAFNWLIKKGYAKYWCTSMWSSEAIVEAIKICEDLGLAPPIADQCEYNCLTRDHVEKDYRRIFERFGYGTTTWSPLCGGILTGKYNDGTIEEGNRYESEFMKAFSWDRYMGDNVKGKTLEILKGLKEYSEELGVTQAQLALAWVIVNKDVST